MAITMMCDPKEPGARLDDYWTRQSKHEVYLRTTHEGRVLSTRERNGYDDSDFYALVWEPNEAGGGVFREIEYASTRGWTYPNHAHVDATPEVLAIWRNYLTAMRALGQYIEEGKPAVGRRCRILPNRGKAKALAGREGRIFWRGERRSRYGTWSYGWRVGVDCGGERVFISETSIEVLRDV